MTSVPVHRHEYKCTACGNDFAPAVFVQEAMALLAPIEHAPETPTYDAGQLARAMFIERLATGPDQVISFTSASNVWMDGIGVDAERALIDRAARIIEVLGGDT